MLTDQTSSVSFAYSEVVISVKYRNIILVVIIYPN